MLSSRLDEAPSEAAAESQQPELSRTHSVPARDLQGKLQDKLAKLIEAARDRRRQWLRSREWQAMDKVSVQGRIGHLQVWDAQTAVVQHVVGRSGATEEQHYPTERVLNLVPLRFDLQMTVERKRIIRSGLAELARRSPMELIRDGRNTGLRIAFAGERAIDAGGVLHDFVDSLGAALVADVVGGASSTMSLGLASLREGPVGLLVPIADHTLMPAPLGTVTAAEANVRDVALVQEEHRLYLSALGRLLALALLNRCPCPLPLSETVFRCLLGVAAPADALRKLDPDLWRNRLRPLLVPNGVDEYQQRLKEWGLDPLTFISIPHGQREGGVPLCEGGLEKLVTQENREEYIRLCCDDYLVGGVRVELSCLLEGFWELLPKETLQASGIDAQELMMLIVGVQQIDVDEWERKAIVHPNAQHQARGLFNFLRGKSLEDRSRLLAFATGSSRLPPGGWDALKAVDGRPLPFKITVEGHEGQLPTAHTCFNHLVLPPVDSEEALAERLELVLTHAGREMLFA